MLQLHMILTSGDATLLRFCESDNEINILIDGGNRRNDCIDYLKALRIQSIDLLIASHLDEDHIRGLRRIADEIEVKELWITNISPLIRPAAESIYMMKCFFESSLVIDGKAVRKKLAVYDGYEKQIGPFYLQVLSPPKSLHDYLREPEVVKDILKSKKGQTIKKYVKKLWRTQIGRERRGGRDQVERREKIVSEIVERFKVQEPQAEEIIREQIERDEVDPTYWREIDKYYESARSLFNDISIVVSITYNYRGITKRFLFPGDLTNWSLVLAKYPQLITNRILKVPHHGSEIYYDPEDYIGALLENYFDLDFWRRLPHPWHHILDDWEERYFIFREILKWRLPPLYFPFFVFPPSILSMWWNNKDIYEWLAPERALIYPLKNHGLPILGIRNQIINASRATSCTFRQGRVDAEIHELKNSCINCYNCIERDVPIVLE